MDSPLGTGDEGPIPLGQHDPETSRLVLSRSRTLPTAEAYVTEFHAHPDGHTLRTYANMAMVWQGNRYIEIEDATLRNRLLPWLHAAAQYRQTKAGPILVPFNAYPPTVNSALETLKEFTHLPASIPMPCWLDDNPSRPPALEILQCRNGNLHVPTRTIMPPTPALFSPNAIGFDYDGHATTPARWLGFLDQLWGGDEQSIALLQEYFGYSLIADTSQQKALLVVGPRRAGKGTIGRVLTRLVGASNVVGPTCGGLASHFGLQGLIGKILAIISDARFHGDSIPALVERLLCIIGEDSIAVERKYLPPVTLRLPTRFVFFTNELPQFKDSSSALAGRFLVLRLTKSFYGAEDPALTDKLATELPGILNWALDGLMRLRARGRFVVPQSSEDAVRELEDLASPVGAFVRECCVVGPGHRVEVTKVWEAWKAWCADLGRNHTGDKQRLGKDLAAAVPGLLRRRGTNEPFYEGIDLNKGGWKP